MRFGFGPLVFEFRVVVAEDGVADGDDEVRAEEGDFAPDAAVDLGFGAAGAVADDGEMVAGALAEHGEGGKEEEKAGSGHEFSTILHPAAIIHRVWPNQFASFAAGQAT